MAGLWEALCWALHTSRRKLEAGLGWPGASAWGCVSAACTPVPPQSPPSLRGSVLGARRLPALPSAELESPEGPQQQ